MGQVREGAGVVLWVQRDQGYNDISARLSPEQPAGKEIFKSWRLENFVLRGRASSPYAVVFMPNTGQQKGIPSAFHLWGLPEDMGVNVLFTPTR